MLVMYKIMDVMQITSPHVWHEELELGLLQCYYKLCTKVACKLTTARHYGRWPKSLLAREQPIPAQLLQLEEKATGDSCSKDDPHKSQDTIACACYKP